MAVGTPPLGKGGYGSLLPRRVTGLSCGAASRVALAPSWSYNPLHSQPGCFGCGSATEFSHFRRSTAMKTMMLRTWRPLAVLALGMLLLGATVGEEKKDDEG